jgi:hypothetical protein
MPAAENGIAHDQEGSRDHQYRDCRKGLGARPSGELVEAWQTACEYPIARTAQAGDGKAEHQSV